MWRRKETIKEGQTKVAIANRMGASTMALGVRQEQDPIKVLPFLYLD